MTVIQKISLVKMMIIDISLMYYTINLIAHKAYNN